MKSQHNKQRGAAESSIRFIPERHSKAEKTKRRSPPLLLLLPAVAPAAPRCIWSLQTPCEPPASSTGRGPMKPAKPDQTHTHTHTRGETRSAEALGL